MTIAARNREKDPTIRTLHQNILDLLRARDQQPGRDAEFIKAIAYQAGLIARSRERIDDDDSAPLPKLALPDLPAELDSAVGMPASLYTAAATYVCPAGMHMPSHKREDLPSKPLPAPASL